MNTESRKAKRNSFAHHRAHLLFAPPQTPTETRAGRTSLLLRVRAGIGHVHQAPPHAQLPA